MIYLSPYLKVCTICNKTLLSQCVSGICAYVCIICVSLLFLPVHTNYFKLNCRLFFIRTYWPLIALVPPLYCSTVQQRKILLWNDLTHKMHTSLIKTVKQASKRKATFLEILRFRSCCCPSLKVNSILSNLNSVPILFIKPQITLPPTINPFRFSFQRRIGIKNYK